MDKMQREFGHRMVRFVRLQSLCLGCPWRKNFDLLYAPVQMVRSEGLCYPVSDQACTLCHDFINIPDPGKWSRDYRCPCYRLGAKRARARATAAVKRWLNGKHKWQKED